MALPRSQWLLVALEFPLVAGACLGGVALVADPTGALLGLSPTILRMTPFATFLLPGILLLLGFGAVPVAVAIASLRRHRWAAWGHVAIAVGLVVWMFLQVLMIGFASVLQGAYLVYGLVLLSLALWQQRQGESS